MGEKVGVIGLGQMGAGMAARLVECGHDVVGYDLHPEARANAAANGITSAETLAGAVAGRSVVLSSLPDPGAVRAAWTGEGGMIGAAAPSTLLIELSTIDPTTMREVGAAAEARGLAVVDCPVSGSPTDARAGSLTLIVGGDEANVGRAEPILGDLGRGWQHTGPVGTAKVVKIVNNMMSMGNVLVASEAFALGVASGVDPETLFRVLSKSGGRSFHFENRFPKALRNDFRPGFKMELGEKDLALAVDLGRQMRMPTPAASGARDIFAMALAEGYRGQDIVALLSLYRKWAGEPEAKVS